MKKLTCICLFNLLFMLHTFSYADAINSPNQNKKNIRLATTTSTYHSGLLDHLLPIFETTTDYQVHVIASGTGKALRMGENGDVDLIMSHAPEAERKFVENGYGVKPRYLMYNDFVVVGPVEDPAQLKQHNDLSTVFKTISEQAVLFISRGDDSGTHKKELQIWKKIKISPDFSGYLSIGQGMGPTLNVASEMQAYTLTDRGTWLAYQNKLDLTVVYEGGPDLLNPYQVILVNPERYPDINYQGAKAFSDWLVSEQGQASINNFRVNDKVLFIADALKITSDNE